MLSWPLGADSPWTPFFTRNTSFEASWIDSAVWDNKNLQNKTNKPEDLLQYDQIWAGR